MPLFSRNRSTTTYGAIIDIGSGSVGVGIVESNTQEALPNVVYAHRELIPIKNLDEETARAEQLRKMHQALFAASVQLGNEGVSALSAHNSDARVRKILITCASPWSHTVTKEITYAPERSFDITKKLLTDVVHQAEEEIEEDISTDDVLRPLGLKAVERATVDIIINGYHVHDAVGKHAQSMTLATVSGFVPKEIVETAHEVQDKIFPDTSLSCHTFMLVIYCVFRDLYPHTDDLCIANVTGESTELGIVEDGVLTHTVHVPFGSSTLVRKIAHAKGTSPADVMSALRGKSLDPSAHAAHAQAYDDALREKLTELFAYVPIPGTVVTTAPPGLQTFFSQRILANIEAVTGNRPTILELHPSILKEIANSENQDPFITVASRFFHKLHGCGEIETR